jgi:oligoribonuclease NrnB/cAMP/cGMP phosphodiesterase (DHH superfamily)
VSAKVAEAKWYSISGISGPVLGVEAKDDISCIGNALAITAGLGMVFRVIGEQVVVSFRSVEWSARTAFDTDKVLSGGGHKHAAGATIRLELMMEFENG